jgi:hypothetical protein
VTLDSSFEKGPNGPELEISFLTLAPRGQNKKAKRFRDKKTA